MQRDQVKPRNVLLQPNCTYSIGIVMSYQYCSLYVKLLQLKWNAFHTASVFVFLAYCWLERCQEAVFWDLIIAQVKPNFEIAIHEVRPWHEKNSCPWQNWLALRYFERRNNKSWSIGDNFDNCLFSVGLQALLAKYSLVRVACCSLGLEKGLHKSCLGLYNL